MTKPTIKRAQPGTKRGRPAPPEPDTGINATMGEDSELLLLALLEQLHGDRAAGLYRDLWTYCAANPELSDAFLELAAATEWEEYEDITGFTGASDSPLSPGVQKALASIPEFSEFESSTSLQHRRVAENKSSYRAHRPGKRSDA
jgi:hypothetical protein